MTSHLGSLAISDSGFVFDPNTGNTYAVNATGLAVLRGLKNGRTLGQIHEALWQDFENVRGVEDLREFTQILIDLGLLPEGEFKT
jgi:hypothetical protein